MIDAALILSTQTAQKHSKCSREKLK